MCVEDVEATPTAGSNVGPDEPLYSSAVVPGGLRNKISAGAEFLCRCAARSGPGALSQSFGFDSPPRCNGDVVVSMWFRLDQR
jgi:hypothetical protein